MPRVPVYESDIQPRALPGYRQESVATPALLGGGSESLSNLGKGLVSAGIGIGAVAYDMQERENADKVFQAETKIKADYLSFEAQIREGRQGGFSKGITQDAHKWWDEQAKKHLETLDNEVQRKLFIRRTAPLRLSSLDSVSKFEAHQMEIAHDQSWRANKVASIDLAAAHADETTVATSTAEIKRLNAYQAARKGWTPEALKAANDEDITAMHQQVIQTLVKSNPAAAEAYFKAHKPEIRGSLRAELGDFAEKATAEALGVAAAGEIWADLGPQGDREASNLDKMEQKARDKFKNDPHVLKATIANLRERHQAFNTGRQERSYAMEATVNEAILKGATIAQVRQMPEFLRMAPEKARAIETFMENRAYTKAAREQSEETLRQTRLRHEGLDEALRLQDPDVLVKMTRAEVLAKLPVLGEFHTTNLVRMHDALTRSSEALAAARIDNNTFKAMAVNAGLNPNEKNLSEDDKDRLVRLRAAVDARLALAARQAGKPLTIEERTKVAQAAFDDVVRVPGFFSIQTYGTGKDLPASSLSPEERREAVVILPAGRVRIRDIPPLFVEQAEAALRQGNRPVTQKAVAEMWLLNRSKWRP
jgi:hypothetical protein